MLAALSRWNRWGEGNLDSGIERDALRKIVPYLETEDIIVLTGPRRAGKSTILFQLMDQLEKQGVSQEAMLHINFEEPDLIPHLDIALLDKLYNLYREKIYPEKKAYLFLDEIQNIAGWERWVRARNKTEDVKIFVTGSSAHLMSREFSTVLTGRHLSFNIYPLSFREFLRFNNISLPKKLLNTKPKPIVKNALNRYLQWGGFPKVVLAIDDQHREKLLSQYFDDILYKDVVVRHKIRDVMALRNLAIHLLTQSANLISFQKISKQLGVSLDLASNYCGYLQEAFLIDFVPLYSLKLSERNRNPQKVHAVDLGLRNIAGFAHSPDNGRIAETAVYHVLQQMLHDGIFYWKKHQEIDFVIRKGTHVSTLVQVTAENLNNDKVYQREIGALQEAGHAFPKAEQALIVGDGAELLREIPVDVMPLWLYLLEKNQ